MKLDKYFDLIDSIEFANDKNYKRLMDGVRQHLSQRTEDIFVLLRYLIIDGSQDVGHEVKYSTLIIDLLQFIDVFDTSFFQMEYMSGANEQSSAFQALLSFTPKIALDYFLQNLDKKDLVLEQLRSNTLDSMAKPQLTEQMIMSYMEKQKLQQIVDCAAPGKTLKI